MIPGFLAPVHLPLNTENKPCSDKFPFQGTQFVPVGSPGPLHCQPVFLLPGVTLEVCIAGLTLSSFCVALMALANSPNDCPIFSHVHWWNLKQFSPTIDLDFAFDSAARRDHLGLEGDGATHSLLLQEQLSLGHSTVLSCIPLNTEFWVELHASWRKWSITCHMSAVCPRWIPDDLFNKGTSRHWANVSKEVHLNEATISTVFLDQGLSKGVCQTTIGQVPPENVLQI